MKSWDMTRPKANPIENWKKTLMAVHIQGDAQRVVKSLLVGKELDIFIESRKDLKFFMCVDVLVEKTQDQIVDQRENT